MQQKEIIKKKAKGLSLRFLLTAGTFLFSLLVFVFIANEMVLEKENGLDTYAFHELSRLTSTSTTSLMVFITFFGSSYFLLPAWILLIAYFLFFKKDRKLSLDVAAIGVTSTIILFSLKAIFHRHRPANPVVSFVNGFSFPSGHSFSSFTFFGLLIYILWNHRINPALRWVLTILFFLFACAIATSRVYLHVHYASDVIAGFCLCMLWLTVSLWLLNKWGKKLPA